VEGYLTKAKWYLDGKEMFVILPTDLCIYPHCEFSEYIEIDKTTICQYTGLTDKNGNKIWENDILRGHGNPKDLAKVAFGKFHVIEVESLENIDSVIGWHTEVIPTDALSKCEPFCLPMPLTDFYIDFSEFEVIGNIFESPELLQEDKR
jgi:hypothetical protein